MPGNVTCNMTKLFCHVVSRFSVREVSLPCGARAISITQNSQSEAVIKKIPVGVGVSVLSFLSRDHTK